MSTASEEVFIYWDGSVRQAKRIHEMRKEIEGAWCVDLYYDTSDPGMRYGKFIKSEWQSGSLEDFPAEFRTHLLLLGVS